jgi:CO/xanthine dehydrogenase FAD-binding subunit
MGSYVRPATLDAALDVLADISPLVLAGGTDVYPAHVGRPIDEDVLDVSGLAGLRRIEMDGGMIRIPALATWTDLVRADLPPAFDGLTSAARAIGGVQIQNRGTICGNLCNASPAADGLPNLMALDSRVELQSRDGGRRELDVGDFVLGNRRTARRADELVTAILVPRPDAAARSCFLKLGARAYLVISIVAVACVIGVDAEGRISRSRLVVGACSEVPQRLEGAERRLVGEVAEPAVASTIVADDLAQLTPIDDVRAVAAYRRDAALVLARRAVATALA